MGFIAIGAVTAGAGIYDATQASKAANASLAQQQAVENQQEAIANQQNQRASALYNRYMNTFAPAQNALIQQAETPIDANVVAGQAAGDVQQAEAKQGAELGRYDARYGINPNSGASQALRAQMGIQDTAAQAGAATGARRYAQQETFNRLKAVANMGNDLLNATGSFTGQAQRGLSDVGAFEGQQTADNDNLASGYGQMAGYGLSQIGGALNQKPQYTVGPPSTNINPGAPATVGLTPINYTPMSIPGLPAGTGG